MFSMFLRKKTAETPTEDVIQGPADPQRQNNGDDFIFVERKADADPTPAATHPNPATTTPGSMYPAMPAYGGLPYPMPAMAMGNRGAAGGSVPLNTPVSYLQDIPFELSPQLTSKEQYTGTQMQVDGILAFMTRQLSVDESAEDYTFALERAIQNECY